LRIYAVAPLLSIFEVFEAILRYLIANNLIVRRDDWSRRNGCASQGPYLLIFKYEEVIFAAIDNWVVRIVCVNDLVVTISEEEEAYFALWSVALSCTLNSINGVREFVKHGVVDVYQAILTLRIASLNAFTILKKDGLFMLLLVPDTNVLVDIKRRFGVHLRAPSPAVASLNGV